MHVERALKISLGPLPSTPQRGNVNQKNHVFSLAQNYLNLSLAVFKFLKDQLAKSHTT
jgi:hypothetical protein